ncbi:amino acid ABC transporter permease [Alloyangia pacifica]|uniref:amino acid ABC transporter permease n=1 Tax=Alloyangia pacifica TaxID=311180 RepID=UPI001CFCF130|nr:ABC transporter permease subunit [Alloyangia pacifica]
MTSYRRTRAFWIQVAAGLALIVAVVLLVRAAQTSLAAQGVTSGFGFLQRSTGWDISFSLIPYTISDPYWKVLLAGLLNTLFLGVIGLALASVLGVIVGTLRTANNAVLNAFGTTYVEVLRNVPLILQAFFWYAVFTHLPRPKQALVLADAVVLSSRGIYLPGMNISASAGMIGGALILAGVILALVLSLLPRPTLARRRMLPRLSRIALFGGFGLGVLVMLLGKEAGMPLLNVAELKGLRFDGGVRISPEFAALLVAMSLYGGAYLGEIIRAGFMSVSRGQIEAAKALGLTTWQVFSRVRLPMALRAVLPTLTNQYVWLLKATTLGIAVGYSDFFLVISTSINQSGQTVELILILMAGFLIMNNVLAGIMNFINRRIALRGTQLRT